MSNNISLFKIWGNMLLTIINGETSAQILIQQEVHLSNTHTYTHTHISKYYRSFLNLKWKYTMFIVLELVFLRINLRQLVLSVQFTRVLHHRFPDFCYDEQY